MRQKYQADIKGAVTAEFLLMLPLFLAFFVMSFVVFDTLKHETTTSKAAYTIGDIVSRQTVLDNDFLDGVHSVFRSITRSDESASWARFTSVTRTDTEFLVDWSYVSSESGSQEAILDADDLFWTAHMPDLATGETILYIEIYRDFETAFGSSLAGIEGLATKRKFELRQVVPLRFTEQMVNTDFPTAFGTAFHNGGESL